MVSPTLVFQERRTSLLYFVSLGCLPGGCHSIASNLIAVISFNPHALQAVHHITASATRLYSENYRLFFFLI